MTHFAIGAGVFGVGLAVYSCCHKRGSLNTASHNPKKSVDIHPQSLNLPSSL